MGSTTKSICPVYLFVVVCDRVTVGCLRRNGTERNETMKLGWGGVDHTRRTKKNEWCVVVAIHSVGPKEDDGTLDPSVLCGVQCCVAKKNTAKQVLTTIIVLTATEAHRKLPPNKG